MKNKIFSILLAVLLSLPVCVWAVDENTQLPEPVVNTLDEEVEEIQVESQYKEPISKRKIAKKFLFAMGGVAASSFSIFFILTVYNRVREKCLNKVKTLEGESSLEAPVDVKGAIKSFLDKTNWKV